MGNKLTSAIVAAGLVYGSRVFAQEAVEPAGDLPDGLNEFGVLSDSETWNKLIGVEKREDGTYLKLNERLAVKTTRGYDRNFGLEDVMVFVQDTDPVDKRKDPEKKDFRYLRGSALTSRLPDWVSDGSFRVYLLSGRGQISARHPERVYRLDEHYELPAPSGVLEFGASAGSAAPTGNMTPEEIYKVPVVAKKEEPKTEAKPEAKPVVKETKPEVVVKPVPKVKVRPAVRESAAKRLFKKLGGAYRLEGGFANTDVASPNTDSSMSGLSGGVGAVVVHPFRAWRFGSFADFYRRSFDTENTYAQSLGSGNHSDSFSIGVAGGVSIENSRRSDLFARALLGYLGHRGKNDFDELSFRESGNGLVLEGEVYLPRLFKNKSKYFLGLKDEFSLEALSLNQAENNFNFESRYGWKTRGNNRLLTSFVPRGGSAELGWQLDSAYSLTPVSNNPFNVTENSADVETRGNLYGNQLVGNVSLGSRRFVSLGGVLSLSGEVRRYEAELRFGNLKYAAGLKYEDVEAEGVKDRRFVVSLDLGRGLTPRRRITYPGLR